MSVLWLVPISYAIHLVEETPRFIPWTKKYSWLFTDRFTMPLFIFGNALFMLYVLMSVSLAITIHKPQAMLLGVSTASCIFSNFLLHAVLTLWSGEYSPGIVTAGSIYVPVSLYVYISLGNQLNANTFIGSVIIGFAVMYIPQLNAIRIANLDRKKRDQQIYLFRV